MRRTVLAVTIGCTLLCGCGQPSQPDPQARRASGRFAGIGVFDAGRMWAQMHGPGEQTSPELARLADDEHIIVVVDSQSGEVRQCGDHSGYCVAMNPWAGAKTGTLPAKLVKHAADLAVEDRAAAGVPVR